MCDWYRGTPSAVPQGNSVDAPLGAARTNGSNHVWFTQSEDRRRTAGEGQAVFRRRGIRIARRIRNPHAGKRNQEDPAGREQYVEGRNTETAARVGVHRVA